MCWGLVPYDKRAEVRAFLMHVQKTSLKRNFSVMPPFIAMPYPCTGFYEWKHDCGKKPVLYADDGALFAFAGIYEVAGADRNV